MILEAQLDFPFFLLMIEYFPLSSNLFCMLSNKNELIVFACSAATTNFVNSYFLFTRTSNSSIKCSLFKLVNTTSKVVINILSQQIGTIFPIMEEWCLRSNNPSGQMHQNKPNNSNNYLLNQIKNREHELPAGFHNQTKIKAPQDITQTRSQIEKNFHKLSDYHI